MAYSAGIAGAVHAPRLAVWQVLTDLPQMHRWHPLIVGTDLPAGGGPVTGGRFTARVRGVGPVTYRVSMLRPGWQYVVEGEPLPGAQERSEYILTDELDGSCRICCTVRLTGPLAPLLARLVDRALASLPHRLEAALAAPAAVAAD